MSKKKDTVDHDRIARLLKSGRSGAPKGAPAPDVKLDKEKLAKQLGASKHFPVETPFSPVNPAPMLDEIRRKRGKGKST